MALTEIDRHLLKRCLANEPGAWKDFVDRFLGLFVHVIHHTGVARSVPIGPVDLDDLCAEIFLSLVSHDYAILRQFRGQSSLATYLTVIARRIVVREVAKRRIAESAAHLSPSVHVVHAEPEQARIDNQDEIRRMLLDLPPADAEVVRLYHLEGRTYREISHRLGIPENSIGPTLTRARDKLRHRRAL